MSGLAAKQCVPCKGGVPPLQGEDLAKLLDQVGGGWRVVDEHQSRKRVQVR